MNCKEFNNLVTTLADNRLLDAQRRGEALEHAAQCSACDTRFAAERKLTYALRAAAEADRMAAPAHVKTALLQAFAAQQQSQTASNVIAFPTPARRFRPWAIAAALLLSAVLPLALLWRYTRQQVSAPTAKSETTPIEQITAVPPTPIQSATPTKPAQVSVKPTGITSQRVNFKTAPAKFRRESRPRSVAQAQPSRGRQTAPAAAENYQGFIALTYNRQDANEGGMVVRVNVSRATLNSLGLPSNGGNNHEQVKADLLVGDDGVARAIRFVPETDAATRKAPRKGI